MNRESGVDKGLVAMFLKMSPEERLPNKGMHRIATPLALRGNR